MLNRARALVLLWLVSAFLIELALGCSEFPLLELRSEQSWSPHTATSIRGVDRILETSTRTTTLPEISVQTLEASQQAPSESIQPRNGVPASTACRKRAGIKLSPYILLRRLGMSLCFFLLVGAGFFTAAWGKPVANEKALPAPQEGEGPPSGLPEEEVRLEDEAHPAELLKVPIDSGLPATRVRLVKIKGLLPTAARLADAVDSAEARELFKKVQDTVNEGLQAAQLRNDTTKLEPALTSSLTALRRLHEVSREKAAGLLLGDRFLQAFPELELWESDVMVAASELQGDMMRQAVGPFLRTIRSLQQSVQTLSKRVGNVGTWLHAERQFEDEGDEEALLTAAVNLECLYSTSEARRHSFEAAGQVYRCTINAAKALLMAERDGVVWHVDEQLRLLRIQTFLEMGKAKTDTLPAEDGSYNIRAKQIHLEALQQQMDLVLALSAQLRAQGEALRSASTLQAAVIHNSKAKMVEEQTVPLLKKCAAGAKALCKPADQLESSGKRALERAGQWLEGVVKARNRAYFKSLGEATAQVKQLVDELEAGTANLRDTLILMQKKCVAAIAKNAARNMEVAANSLGLLERPKLLGNSTKRLMEVVGCLQAQTLDTMSLRLVNQNCRLMQIVQNDLDYADSEIRRAMHRSIHLEGQEKITYALLHQQLTEAKAALKEAVTIGVAAEAAAQVRSRLLALQDFLFASEKLGRIHCLY